MIRHWVDPDTPLPPADQDVPGHPGLIALGSDLGPKRLLEAYSNGLFPWYSAGQPVLWWSPDPRMVVFVDEFSPSRTLRRLLRQLHNGTPPQRWTITLDTAFTQVMRACAEPRPGQDGTWITDAIISAYSALHRQGLAHSLEVWETDAPPDDTARGSLPDPCPEDDGDDGISASAHASAQALLARISAASASTPGASAPTGTTGQPAPTASSTSGSHTPGHPAHRAPAGAPRQPPSRTAGRARTDPFAQGDDDRMILPGTAPASLPGARLVGGLYGVSIGRMFFGESMFTRRPNASKCAFAALMHLLARHGLPLVDCQQSTRHLGSLGGRDIPRSEFLDRIQRLLRQPAPDWRAMARDLHWPAP